MLTATVERVEAATSATSEQHAANDPAVLLRKQVAQYLDALNVAAESLIGAENLARLAARAEQLVPGVTDCDAWPALRSQLAMIGLDGTNPCAALQRAQNQQSLDGADDVAAVLAWRLLPEQRPCTGTVPALPAVPRGVEADDYWHRYFDRRQELIDRYAGELRDQVAQWTSTTAPTWAASLVARARNLTADLAVWRAGHDVPDSEQRPSGGRRADYAGWRAQRQLDRRIDAALGSADSATARWRDWADTIDRRITNDPTWPHTAAALDAAEHAGMTRPALAQLATQRPLPDEQPAAALRWRLDGAAAEAIGSLTSAPSKPQARPRPTWTPTPTSPPTPTMDYARAFGNRPTEPPRRGR